VIGKGRHCPPDICQLAQQAGAAVAQLHPAVVMICGGLDGVMDYAARGMTAGHGIAIGLLPDTERAPSQHLTYAIRTGLPENHRNIMTASASDLAVVLPGSHGTLIEAWAAADRGVPLIGVGDHCGYLTDALPFTNTSTPDQLAGMIAGYLGLTQAPELGEAPSRLHSHL
jgi:uncharacterized protein (TIGR00725 family)